MNNHICNQIRIKFSIPGRMRLNINLLYKNKFLAQKTLEMIKSKSNIFYANININTSNLLIIYNNEKLSEIELTQYIKNHFIELQFIQNDKDNNDTNSIFENEKVMSKRVTLISVILIAMVSIVEFNAATIVSIMILASPHILFYIRNKGYELTSHLLLERKVNLQDNFLIKFFGQVDEIFIQDDLIINKEVVKQYTNFLEKDSLSVQKHVIYRDLEDPIYFDLKKVVKNLRNIGVNKIYIVSKETNKFIDYAKNTLGINSLTLKDNYMKKYIDNFLEDPLIIVLRRSSDNNEKTKLPIIYVYTEINELKYKDNLSCVLCKNNIIELPYSILVCKFMEIGISNIENISLAINMIGILFAISKYIFIKGSIGLYFLNLFLAAVLLKKNQIKNNLTVLNLLK